MVDETFEKQLPQLLSVSSIKKECFAVKTVVDDRQLPTKKHLRQKLQDMLEAEANPEIVKKNLTTCKSLLELIDKSKADNYATWWDIGTILFNVGKGSDEAFRIWNRWSRLSDAYDEDGCASTWGRMTLGRKGLGSLKWQAKTDNGVGYSNYVESQHGLELPNGDEQKTASASLIREPTIVSDQWPALHRPRRGRCDRSPARRSASLQGTCLDRWRRARTLRAACSNCENGDQEGRGADS